MSKIFTFAAASLLTAASLFHLGAEENVSQLPAPSTMEDLQKAALAFEAAHDAFSSNPSAEIFLNYRKVFKVRVTNCHKESALIVKKVTQGIDLSTKFVKKKYSDETKAFAKTEVLKKLDGLLKKIENGTKVATKEAGCTACGYCSFGLMKVAKDYYVGLMNVDKDLYNQRKIANHACKGVVKSLIQQGISVDAIKEEMQKAGVKSAHVIGKVDHWAQKA